MPASQRPWLVPALTVAKVTARHVSHAGSMARREEISAVHWDGLITFLLSTSGHTPTCKVRGRSMDNGVV